MSGTFHTPTTDPTSDPDSSALVGVAPAASAAQTTTPRRATPTGASRQLLERSTFTREPQVVFGAAWSDDLYFATCGGRVVTVFTADGAAVQSYMDPNLKEDFYSCVFAGRSQQHMDYHHGHGTFALITRNTQQDNESKKPTTPVRKRKRWSIDECKEPEPSDDSSIQKYFTNTCSADESIGGGSSSASSARNGATTDTTNNKTGTGPQLLCFGGLLGTITVIDTVRQIQIANFQHGDQVLDLASCPVQENYLLSASHDKSCRLWDLHARCLLQIFAAHKDVVTSVAWHPTKLRMVSGSMDRTVKVWDVCVEKEKDAQAFSLEGNAEHVVSTKREHFPIFSTDKLHFNVVDCVAFVGDLVLSKSIDDCVELWSPCLVPTARRSIPSNDFVHLQRFDYTGGACWFIKFACNPMGQTLAVGNQFGKIFVWDIDQNSNKPKQILSTSDDKSIRALSFSSDGSMLVATNDDCCVHKWNVVF
jgi:polycomb protein EED